MSQPASIALVTSAELDKVLQNRPNLKPGDKIESKVIKVREDGKVVMDFGKFQAAVELKTQVKQGDVIRLEVVKKGKQLKLKLEQLELKAPKEPKNIIKQTSVQQEKAVEQLQSKIHQLAQKEIKATPQFSENIQVLYENIKTALRLLQANLQVSGNQLEIPGEIRQVVLNFQSNLNMSEITDNLSNQLSQLKALLQDSGLPYEKVLAEVLNTLNGMLTRLSELKGSQQPQELQTFIQNQLKTFLKSLGDILADPKLMQELENPQKLLQITQTLRSLQTYVENILSRALDPSSELSQLMEFSEKEEKPAELKVFYNRGRKKDSPEEFKLSLFLEMDKIGEIRSDFFQLKEDLTITFYVKDDGIKEYFDHHLHEVEEALGPVFENLNLNIVVSREKIAEFEAEEEAEIISDKAVNVKV